MVESRIKTGDLLFFRGQKIHSWLIRLFSQSVYSHVGIAARVIIQGNEVLCVLEALEGTGVRVYPLEKIIRAGRQVDWYQIDDPLISRPKMIAWAISRWGNQYASVWQFLRSFTLLTKWVCDRIGVPTRIDDERYFCSWFVGKALQEGGYLHDPDFVFLPEQATPGALTLLPCLNAAGMIYGL